MKRAIVLVCLIVGISTVLSTMPGINFALKAPSFEDLKDQILPGLVAKVKGSKLPDKTVTYKDYFKCTFTNVKISNFELPADYTDLIFPFENVGEMILEGMNLNIEFDYNYNLLWTKGTGSGVYNIGNAQLALALQSVKDGDFFLIQLSSAQGGVQTTTVHFDGEGVLAGIVNFLSDKLNAILIPISTIELMLGSFEVIQPVLNKFAQTNTKVALGDTGVSLDFGLLRESFMMDRFEFGMYGKFFETDAPSDVAPFEEPFYMPWYHTALSNAQFFVSPYSMNTALYSFWKTGGLKFTLTDDMIPTASTFHLNTSDLDKIYPGLEKQFGEKIPCEILVYPSTYPEVVIKDGQASLTYNGGMITRVIDASNETDAVDVALELDLAISVDVEKKKIIPKFETSKVSKVRINKTAITGLDVFKVASNLEAMDQSLVQVFNEQVFAKGFDLPTIGGISFTNPQVSIPDEYAVVSGTPDFSQMGDFLADYVVEVISKVMNGSIDRAFGVREE